MNNVQMTINEYKLWFDGKSILTDEEIEMIQSDTRQGVKALYQKWMNDRKKEQIKLEKWHLMNEWENKCRQEGKRLIAGIDEAGRGPLAGPVVAAAVILPEQCYIPGLNDSKQCSASQRDILFDEIMHAAIEVSVTLVHSDRIDEINILQATIEAMEGSVQSLHQKPDCLLIDALKLPNLPIPQHGIIKGDATSVSIAAASIIAKVTRDRFMLEQHEIFPQYKFDSNKGYGTEEHVHAIERFGLTPLHRRTFTLKSSS